MAYWIKLEFDHREPMFEFDDEPEKMLLFGLSRGIPADAKRLPTRATETTRKKSYPDIFSMPGLKAVNAKFRDLVEEFEPSVHQFFPLELKKKNGERIEGEYFIFNCCVSFDSLLVSQSDVSWIEPDGPTEYPHVRVGWRHKNVLSRPQIADRHLWCSFRVRCPGFFVSDALHDRMKALKFKYFDASFCDEVDEPWVAAENIQPILDFEAKHGLQPGMKPWLVKNEDVLLK